MSGSGEEASGRVVAGRYRLENVLGRGGMGTVWRAVDTLIERTVALKELRPPQGEDAASFVQRALREARNAGRLNHPGIVAVHDVISATDDDPVVYIVMELVEAPSLAEVIDDGGPLPPARAAAMGVGILEALTAAHAMGIVHRDIKPGNVLVLNGDRVKLTDFGIALAAEDSRLTRTGVMGTHGYLAPECFDDGQVGPATDLWALGATLFHAVAAKAPFERTTTTATLRAILFEDPPPPPCPPPLADVIRGLLTRPVEQRLTSSAAREQLERAVVTAPTVEAPPTLAPGQAPWEGSATTHHRRPTPTPPPPGPPPPHTTHPGGPPAPYVTGPQGPGAPHPTTGPTGPMGPGFGPSSMGVAAAGGPPPSRNNTPLILGLLGAVAAVLLVVIFTAGGGDDDDDGASEQATGELPNGLPTIPDPTLPDLDDSSTTDDQGCCDDGGANAEAVAEELLTAVGSGDATTAESLLCSDSSSQGDISDAIAGGASLDIDPSTVIPGSNDFAASLMGTLNGTPISSGYISVYPRDDVEGEEGWCVFMFYAFEGSG